MRFGMQRRMARRLVKSPGVVDYSCKSATSIRVTRQADLGIRLLGRPFFVPSSTSSDSEET
jgi:hypothetical protein